jgi:hypothetical protein
MNHLHLAFLAIFKDLVFSCILCFASIILALLQPMASSGGSTQTAKSPLAVEASDYVNGRPVFKKHHYDKIPVDTRGAIRILKLYPGSPKQDDVLCELIPGTILSHEECQDHDPPLEFKPYDALSWCWGKDPQNGKISIRMGETSYVKFVQPSLVAALRALRHETHDRHIWADAVCINQDYKAEKNHQVEMMADIYGRADCVRIWLGDPDVSSNTAILFIKQQVLQLHHFDDLCQSTKFSDKWKALLELMQREWFSRRWVVQEVSLAPKAIIHCGAAKLSWNKFAVAVELFVEVETATHRLSEVRFRFSHLTIGIDGFTTRKKSIHCRARYGHRLLVLLSTILICSLSRLSFHNHELSRFATNYSFL